jgi:hypothetical protein
MNYNISMFKLLPNWSSFISPLPTGEDKANVNYVLVYFMAMTLGSDNI